MKISDLPEKHGPSREDAILNAIRRGEAEYRWTALHHFENGRRVTLRVMEDAIRLDGVRVAVSARTAQLAADALACVLPTAKLCDIIYAAATKVDPQPRRITADTLGMIEHSRDVDRAIAGRSGLVADVGKDWVLSRDVFQRRGRASNYGWHLPAASFKGIAGHRTVTGDGWVIQPLAEAHSVDHVDYSQVLRLVDDVCEIDGDQRAVSDVLTDPAVAGLLSHEGALPEAHYPTVARILPDGTLVLPEITIVGDVPRDEADTEPAPPPSSEGDVPGVAFTQAKSFTRAGRKSVDLVVIHTAECAEVNHAAENLAKWAAGPQAPRASWHYAVDADSATQSVLEQDVAWHAPGANARGIGIEHAGRASQRAEGWADDYSKAVLRRSAELVAGICKRWGIPVQRVGPDGLKRGERGICGHVDVTTAWRKSTHTDPGPMFPWDDYLRMVAEAGS